MIFRDDFYKFCIKTCCDCSSELSRRDSSDEASQHMVSREIRKIIPQLSSNTPYEEL